MKLTKKIAAAAASAAIAVSSIPVAALNTSAADHNYMEALAMSLYFFDSNACGSGITGGPLTWRGDCHTYDAEASVGDLGGSAKAFVDPDGDGKVDVSGGWHDAGDHIKFNLTIGFALSSLGISDYINPGIYEKAGCRDHLEYEMRWGADYLMKTTFLDDSGKVVAVAHTVADGGTDHSFWSSPEVQTYERPIFWLTANDNNSSVSCEMAAGLGAAAYVFKDSDPEYSAKCAKYAKALLEFGTKHVGNNTGGIGGFYSTDAQYQDEEAIAQAWLWIVGEGDKPTRVPKNKDYGGSQYDGWVYSWDKVWQGYATLMYKATGDSAFRDELIVEIDGQGGMKVGKYNTNGWGTSRINCAIQMDAYTVADGDPNSEYAQGAKWQLDYILGDNNLGYSFLLGFGDKWPVHIHHRAANPGGDGITSAQNPAAKYTNYGMLVGGIDANGYEDHADRYQYTEGALDYNGCFAIASACAANLFGGDATTFDAIKNSAAEINADFKFADESVTPPEDNPPSSNPPTDIVYGDANCDGNVTIADSAAILQFLGNSDKYFLSEQGELNADVNGQAGITPDDALVIQRVDAGMISVNDLPLTQ
ncbi:MAG: glycoside hydrolase family 9 protein [Ruminococcus sp.]|nr:glycoside hydrolase family 9 protein [Ruminococcus sp.]